MVTRSVHLADAGARMAGVTLVRGFPEPGLHTRPSLGHPGWLQGLWIAWKDSSGSPEAWQVFSLLLTPSPQVPLSLFLLSPQVTFPPE